MAETKTRPTNASIDEYIASCLYFRRLADIDVNVLEALMTNSVAEIKRRYPTAGAA